MTGLFPNWLEPKDYSTKCPIIPPTKKNGEWVTFKYAEYLSCQNHIKHWVDDVNNRRHYSIDIEQVRHKKGGLHDNLLSFALLPRKTPYTPRPVGERWYLILNLNFAENQPWECWKTTWTMRVWASTIVFVIRSGLEGLVAWGMSLWVVLTTPECGIRGIMGGPKLRQNMWKLSVLPIKRG